MFIIFYIYGAFGSFLFGHINDFLWGNIARSMLTLFSALLTDPEREVKTVACSDLSKLCDFVGAEAFTPALLVQLKSLLEDESPNVRSTLVRRA